MKKVLYNKQFIKELFIFMLVLTIATYSIMTLLNTYSAIKKAQYEEYIGIRAVNLMYDFDSIFDLTSQMSELQEITTPEVYKSLDINYDSRIIPIYFKFKAEPTKVKIISSFPGSIHYRLLNNNVSSERSFLFRYTVSEGVINFVEEVELVTGIDNTGGVIYK